MTLSKLWIKSFFVRRTPTMNEMKTRNHRISYITHLIY